nr:MAG TPA: hypothetical protein [Caudoviricetes sp.]
MPRFPSFERKSPVSEFGAAGRDGPDGSGCLAKRNVQARRLLGRPGGRRKVGRIRRRRVEREDRLGRRRPALMRGVLT